MLGRPRKLLKNPVSPSASTPVEGITPAAKKPVPLLEGEIIRLQKEGGVSDSKSDSEVDIDGDDDNVVHVKMEKESHDEEPELQLPPDETILQEPPVVEPLPELPEAHESQETEIKSECESSETDTKGQLMQPVFTFAVPLEERMVDLGIITDEEKTIHWDFFEGRPSKTPERYIKIRNSIIQEWRRVKPRYLTKTSVRPSLKNCGDVNCISRVHAYLELTGAINFGCGNLN